MMADVYDKTTQKWIPGTIIEVKRASATNIRVKVEKDGYPVEFAVDLNWPSPTEIEFCGEKIKDR